jgi:ribosomal protein L11 methyltransferase
MIEIRIPVTADLANGLEAHFCEDYQENWLLFEDVAKGEHELRGFFEDRTAADAALGELREAFPDLPSENDTIEERAVADADWKEAYKLHFRAWTDRGLHWVPVWEQAGYDLPAGDVLIPLDPGMAFGTGNHETTRLCVRRLLDVRDAWGAEALAAKSVIDAGCGSGILALSARKLGFGEVYGFDIDPDAVQISGENAVLCDLEGAIEWRRDDLIGGLEGRQADILMANILANVLMEYADRLLAAIKPGGWLILSGILAKEAETVRACFAERAAVVWGSQTPTDSRTDGEWADVCLSRGL